MNTNDGTNYSWYFVSKYTTIRYELPQVRLGGKVRADYVQLRDVIMCKLRRNPVLCLLLLNAYPEPKPFWSHSLKFLAGGLRPVRSTATTNDATGLFSVFTGAYSKQTETGYFVALLVLCVWEACGPIIPSIRPSKHLTRSFFGSRQMLFWSGYGINLQVAGIRDKLVTSNNSCNLPLRRTICCFFKHSLSHKLNHWPCQVSILWIREIV